MLIEGNKHCADDLATLVQLVLTLSFLSMLFSHVGIFRTKRIISLSSYILFQPTVLWLSML